MRIGKGAVFGSLWITWPHQVRLGSRCRLEQNVYLKFDGLWQEGPSIIIGDDCFIGSNCEFNIRMRIMIGNECLIASGVRFIDGDHGAALGTPMRRQSGTVAEIGIEDDVWIGANAVILKGVTIGKGAIVGAGAVVTRSVPPLAIVVGIPAREIGRRGAGRRVFSEADRQLHRKQIPSSPA
jgi:acetyltransferase-like isoleucine patch superfamily enzyme